MEKLSLENAGQETSLFSSKWFLCALIVFGVVVRLVQFLANRSLWLDEAALASSIVTRSYLGLLQLLDHHQVAPVGFLMVERFFVQMFGNSEYALRLFPLLAGIFSLLLFLYVGKRILSPKAVPIAMLLFATGQYLIYYSSEVKPYSCDVAVALLLFSTTFYVMSNSLSVLRLVLFGLLGAISIWFSYPAVFVLAGIGICLTVLHLSRREWAKFGYLSVVFSLWAFSFLLCYIYIIRNYTVGPGLLDFWKDTLMPLPPSSFSEIKWLAETFHQTFVNPGGFRIKVSLIVMICFVVGCVSIFKTQKGKLCLLLSPILFNLLASGLRAYPFGDRVILYIVPTLLIGVAEGVEQIRKRLWISTPAIGIVVVALVIFYPALTAGKLLFKPFAREEIKPLLSYLQDHRQQEDVLYVYCGASKAFKYYASIYGLDKTNYIIGKREDNLAGYTSQLDKLRACRRVWAIFTHVGQTNGISNEKFVLYYLDGIGKRIDSQTSHGASLYLYDLSGAQKTPGL